MRKVFNFKRKLSGDEMMNLEMILGSVLQPVAPRKEFARALHTKLLRDVYPEGEIAEKETKKKFAMLVLSLMGVGIILGVWIRVVIALLMLMGVTLNTKQGLRKRRITSVHSAA